MRITLACISIVLVAGCGGTGLGTGAGGSDLSTPPDLTPGADLAVPPDFTVGPDLAEPPDLTQSRPFDAAGITCGPQTCGGGMKCCIQVQGMMAMPMCMDVCPDGGITVACDGPEDCNGNPCCIDIQGGMVNGGAMCTQHPTDCFPQVDIMSRSGMDRVCHVDADCTDGAPKTQLPSCCSIMQGGNKAHICLNKLFANFIGASCP